MNRIILIGNGFDKSLNLPTGYSQFLDWIFLETLKAIIEKEPHAGFPGSTDYSVENELFSSQINRHTVVWLKVLVENKHNYKYYLEEREKLKLNNYFNFRLSPKHPFVGKLFEFYGDNGWVDIEQLYFEELKQTVASEIENFNSIFETIKGKLSEYLEGIRNEKNNVDTLNLYRKHFFGNVLHYVKGYQSYEESKTKPDSYYFLNFNYTNFLREILDHAPSEILNNVIINNIHGQLGDFPIIFGYGNETGEEYSKLEKQGNLFLENIKSTHYFNSTHYRDLQRQLGEPYEVYVYGLSCGLSDSILLKTIMQKPNCTQIRIFYHAMENKDSFRSTLMNISRVFDDKEDMRRKIISKKEIDFIPQLNN